MEKKKIGLLSFGPPKANKHGETFFANLEMFAEWNQIHAPSRDRFSGPGSVLCAENPRSLVW